MNDTQKVLAHALAILRRPNGMTSGNYARRENGDSAAIVGPDAVSFCSVGAILRAASELDLGGTEASDYFARATGKPNAPMAWSDYHADQAAAGRKAFPAPPIVVDAFERAIVAAGSGK